LEKCFRKNFKKNRCSGNRRINSEAVAIKSKASKNGITAFRLKGDENTELKWEEGI
jgi:predicted DNA binding CopG/RHH family protein